MTNFNLKKVNTLVEFGEQEILEYQKCSKDPSLFYGKLCSYCFT